MQAAKVTPPGNLHRRLSWIGALAALIGCIARPALADPQFFPRHFDLTPYFEACIAATEANERCDAVNKAFTLRREIGLAFIACGETDQQNCEAAFTKAGLPVAALDDGILSRCSPVPESAYGPAPPVLDSESCIEKVAARIESEKLPTAHFTDISCGLHYIECAELTTLTGLFWKQQLDRQVAKYLERVATPSEGSPYGPHVIARLARLNKRRIDLERELARVKCELEAAYPHWNDTMIIEGCLAQSDIALWRSLRAEFPE